MLAVECYDPHTPSFKFVKEVFLYKNKELEPFIKNSNSVDYIKESNFITNGNILLLQTSKRAYYFDMKTGVRICKESLYDGQDGADNSHH